MKLTKSILVFLLMLLNNFSYAKLIELDWHNPDHCRQQLLNSDDILPAVITYNSKDETFRGFFEKIQSLSAQYSDKTIFVWDTKNDFDNSVKAICLQQLGLTIQPNIMLIGVIKENSLMTTPLKSQWAGQMSIEEMRQFIAIPNSQKAILRQQFLT